MTTKRRRTGFLSMSAAERKAAIDRIIAATGKQADDEEKLLANLEGAEIDFDVHQDLKRERGVDYRRKLRRIRTSLESTVAAIDADPSLKSHAAPYDLSRLVQGLRNLETWADRYSAQHSANEGRQSSPVEWLAGMSLPHIYEERFNCPATIDRDENERPRGAVINFIVATLAELDLSYERESIVRAMTRLNKAE